MEKRNGKTSRWISGFLVVCLILGLSACHTGKDGNKSGDVDIWSTYNTTKIMRDSRDYVRVEPCLDIKMAKSEVEGAQIIFTPDYKVESYDVILNDLKSGTAIFSKENVNVYKQGFVNVTSKTPDQNNDAYHVGWTADFLLPLAKAKEYGETTVLPQENQGLTFEFSTEIETKAGIYTGEFLLRIDGNTTIIPVTLTVWDIDISKVYGKSSFGYNYDDAIMSGEFANDLDTLKNYYEFFLDNRMSPSDFPPGADGSPETFVEMFKLFSGHKYFSSFGFPIKRGSSKYTVNAEKLYQYVKPIVKLCTPEKNWLKFAYYYLVPIDEPKTDADFTAIETYRSKIDAMEEKIIAELQEEGFFTDLDGYTDAQKAAFQSELISSLRKIPQIVTTPYNQKLLNKVNTYCPPIQYYNSEFQREQYRLNAIQNNSEQWFYTCMQPIYPYPAFHMDDYLIGARIQKWMQAAYNVNGYLFWESTAFKDISRDIAIDPYTNPNRFYYGSLPFPGDGYLTYPGYKYGQRKPFGSLRLSAYRDGQEDMDFIKEFDRLLKTKNAYYGVEFDVNNVIQGLYNEIFSGAVYNPSDEKLYSVRDRLAALYEYANRKESVVIESGKISETAVTTMVYAAKGCTLRVNGKNIAAQDSGSGSKFVISDDISLNNAEYTFEVFDGMGNKICEYYNFISNRLNKVSFEKDGIAVSENSSVEITGDSAAFVLVSKSEGEYLDLVSFVPSIKFGTQLFENKLKTIDEITFTIQNASSFDMNVSVRFLNANKRYEFARFVVGANSEKRYSISGVHTFEWAKSAPADGIMLAFENLDENDRPYPDRLLTVKDMYFTLRE